MLASINRNMQMPQRRQKGLVLIIVLIVLTAMMLAGMALMRSVDTTTLVAGNMAFRQAATHQGDFGTEAAVAWLESQSSTTLQNTNADAGYFAYLQGPTVSTSNPASDQTWDNYWNMTLDPSPISRPVSTAANSGNVWTLATVNGYTVSYVIHRMCPTVGTNIGCTQSPVSSTAGNNSNKGGGAANFTQNSQIYYRITSRVEGPRNTVSYVQTVVAM